MTCFSPNCLISSWMATPPDGIGPRTGAFLGTGRIGHMGKQLSAPLPMSPATPGHPHRQGASGKRYILTKEQQQAVPVCLICTVSAEAGPILALATVEEIPLLPSPSPPSTVWTSSAPARCPPDPPMWVFTMLELSTVRTLTAPQPAYNSWQSSSPVRDLHIPLSLPPSSVLPEGIHDLIQPLCCPSPPPRGIAGQRPCPGHLAET